MHKYDYRNFPLLEFLSAVPVRVLPKSIYEFLRGRMAPATKSGELKYVPYGLRKIETSLLWSGANSDDIVVAHPDHLDKFIRDDTEIIAATLGIRSAWAVLYTFRRHLMLERHRT